MMLLSIVLQKPNVLLLDEPTNHLDFLTLEAFELALLRFEGAILAVSHDATFMVIEYASTSCTRKNNDAKLAMRKKIDFKEISIHEAPERSPGFLLWHISTSWRCSIEGALRPFDLTHPQFVVLAAVGWLKG
jgi:hypothetical protein